MTADFRKTRTLPLIALLVACGEGRNGVTSPAEVAPAAVSAVTTDLSSRVALISAVEDANSRVLAAFESEPELTALRLTLVDLASALDEPGLTAATVQDPMTRAERLLDPLERRYAREPGALAELSAVRLVLERVGELKSW